MPFAAHAQRAPTGRPSHRPPPTASRVSPAPRSTSPLVPRSSRCACGGSCPACTTHAPLLPSVNLGDVRIHPSAPEITQSYQARAVTIGQDIYFRPGEYRPGTAVGDHLLAHELAHTRQTGHSPGATSVSEWSAGKPEKSAEHISEPGDALEKNADALATGATSHVLAAPAGAILRSPLDNESSTDRARRRELIQALSNAQLNLIRLLQTGGLIRHSEVAVERNGTRGVVVPANTAGTAQERFESYTERDARIRRIIGTLRSMATHYRTAPLPGTLPPSEVNDDGSLSTQIAVPGGSSTYVAESSAQSQLLAAYELERLARGQTGEAFENDYYYIESDIQIVPGAARGARRASGGIQSGAYMVFPNIDEEPLRYWRLDGYSDAPRGSVIVEFWHDDFGYYYMHRGQRIDVPNPWRSR